MAQKTRPKSGVPRQEGANVSNLNRGGTPPSTRPIPGLKVGWLYRETDRMILHRPKQDAPAMPIGDVPPVVGRVTHRLSDRRHTRISFQLQASEGGTRIATMEQILDGSWADLLGRPRPAGMDQRLAFAQILNEDVMRAPEVPSAPTKTADGGLELPAAEAQELGYMRTGEQDELGARQGWRRVLEHASAAPVTTLMFGMFFGGPLISFVPGVPRHVVNFMGGGQQGKSILQFVLASLLGDASDAYKIFGNMNTTGLGLPGELIAARYMPMGREEWSASGLTFADMTKLISRVLVGGNRTRLGQGGTPQASGDSWNSVLTTSSNETLHYPGQPESFASRLIEINPPFWTGQEAAEEARSIATQYHGWPLVWADRAGLYGAERVKGWRALHGEILARLSRADGGIPLTLSRIMAMWGVGAYMLGEVLGMPELGARAEENARELLPRVLGDVAEHHQSPGQALWEAIAGSMDQEPAAWVEPKQLLNTGSFDVKPRRALGYHYGDHQVHAFVTTVKEAAKAAGLNPSQGLRDLAERGVLLPEKGKLSAKPPTVDLRKVVTGRVYVFARDVAEEAFADRETVPSVTPDAVPDPADDSETVAAEQRAIDASKAAPVPAQAPARDVAASRRRDAAVPPVPPMPSVPPATGYPEPEAEESDQEWADLVARAKGRTVTATRFGVLADGWLYLPNCKPVAVPMPATVNDIPGLMLAYRLKTLWLHEEAATALDFPAYDPLHPGGPQAGRAHAWATPGDAIESITPEDGISCWMTITTAQGGHRLNVAVPRYEDRMDRKGGKGRGGFGGAETPAVLLDALMVYLLSTVHGPQTFPKVLPYYLAPNKTAEDYAGGKNRTDVVSHTIRRRGVPPVSTPPMVSPKWHREPERITAEERAALWLHEYDKSAAYLAAFASITLGVGEPAHHERGRRYDKALAGWWRVAELPADDMQDPNNRVDMDRLPKFRLEEAEGGGYWVCTPDMDLLRETYPAWEPRVVEAWVWENNAELGSRSTRALEGMYKLLHASRVYLLRQVEAGRPGARWAKQVNGRLYQSFRGYLGRLEPQLDEVTGEPYANDIYWRPDWAKLILAYAMANTWRNLRKFAAEGRYPLSLSTDAVTFAADTDDPAAAKPAGMKLGTGGGQWTHEGAAPMAELLEYLEKDRAAGHVLDDYLNGRL